MDTLNNQESDIMNDECLDITKMEPEKLVKFLKAVGQSAMKRIRTEHKGHNVPLVYKKDGQLVKEHGDGRIELYKQIQ